MLQAPYTLLLFTFDLIFTGIRKPPDVRSHPSQTVSPAFAVLRQLPSTPHPVLHYVISEMSHLTSELSNFAKLKACSCSHLCALAHFPASLVKILIRTEFLSRYCLHTTATQQHSFACLSSALLWLAHTQWVKLWVLSLPCSLLQPSLALIQSVTLTLTVPMPVSAAPASEKWRLPPSLLGTSMPCSESGAILDALPKL